MSNTKFRTEIKLNVEMTCGGCSAAVERALKKVMGVEEVVTNLTDQSVLVRGNASREEVRLVIQKTGKKILQQ